MEKITYNRVNARRISEYIGSLMMMEMITGQFYDNDHSSTHLLFHREVESLCNIINVWVFAGIRTRVHSYSFGEIMF